MISPTYTQVISSVAFPKKDWLPTYVGTLQKWVCVQYPDVVIERDFHDEAYRAPRRSPGIANPPGDPFVESFYYKVHHGDLVVDTVIFVEIAGGPDAFGIGRALIPLPESGTVVSLYRYSLARIVNQSEANLKYGLGIAGYTVAAA